MVFHRLYFLFGREDLIEIASPAGGGVAFSPAINGAIIDHRLDPTTKPGGSLGFGFLNGPQNFQNLVEPYGRDRQVADNWACVGF